MKILELHVEGFRSLKSVTWKPGDLNVVIGPNASGKSNLLKLLEMLSVAADGRLSRYVGSQGGFRHIMWNGDGVNDSIRIDLTSSPIQLMYREFVDGVALQDPAEFARGQNLTYTLRMLPKTGGGFFFIIDSLTNRSVQVNDGDLVHYYRSNAAYWLSTFGERQVDIEREVLIGVSDEESLLSQLKAPLIKNERILRFQEDLRQWMIYQWFDSSFTSAIRQANIASEDDELDSQGRNLTNYLMRHYRKSHEFKQRIDNAMLAAFGSTYVELDFPKDAAGRVALCIRWTELNEPTPASDLSDGTLRYLYLLAILSNPNPPSVIAIDQPETDLHPNMLPLIAEFAVAASTRCQVILTTHSPQLLDAFSVTDTVPTTTVAEWETGETRLSTIDGDALNGWLKKYSLGDLYNSGTLEAIA